MPEKVTKEEKLVELAIAKAKEVRDLIVGSNDPTVETIQGETVKVKRPKAEKTTEKDTDPIGPSDLKKAPPIPNPTDRVNNSNDNLSEEGIVKLFEEVIDPRIMRAAEKKRTSVFIPLDELKMSSEEAVKRIKQFYTKKMGYGTVGKTGRDVYIMLAQE